MLSFIALFAPNLHYVERHEEHTIAHAVQTNYKKTKVYLWPAPTRTSMKAGRIVQTILHLSGFKNVKSKVNGHPDQILILKIKLSSSYPRLMR
ncbi:hypothetical protein K1719_042259 [Acacia pycnantha]|nr:hypothetical protein K1719_042259 [Acacia pycnantha]